MGKVIDFFSRVPTEYRERAMCRAYGRHRQRCHRLQMENKRKHESEQQDRNRK